MDKKSTSQRLKLLQDVSSSSGLFPSSYWVRGVTKRKRISSGGEATVYVGGLHDRTVVIRQFHTEDAPDDVVKVCRFDFMHSPHTV